jgi:hypothetical protein
MELNGYSNHNSHIVVGSVKFLRENRTRFLVKNLISLISLNEIEIKNTHTTTMGIDHDSKLIIGWYIPKDLLTTWLVKNNARSCSIKRQCLHKDCWENSEKDNLFTRVVAGGNSYEEETTSFYLCINDSNEYTIEEMINLINNKEIIDSAIKLFKEI